MARSIYGYVDKCDLAFIDEMSRYGNPEIPAGAEMIWDPGTRTVRWEWDDGTPAEDQR
jgi:hypothetical protein